MAINYTTIFPPVQHVIPRLPRGDGGGMDLYYYSILSCDYRFHCAPPFCAFFWGVGVGNVLTDPDAGLFSCCDRYLPRHHWPSAVLWLYQLPPFFSCLVICTLWMVQKAGSAGGSAGLAAPLLLVGGMMW